jgi:integrase/recombinase XerD
MVMTNWYENSVKALQLNGKGERTQQSYTRAVRMLTKFYGKTPDRVSEEELQEYFLHRKNVNKWSPAERTERRTRTPNGVGPTA